MGWPTGRCAARSAPRIGPSAKNGSGTIPSLPSESESRDAPRVPERPSLDGLEQKWCAIWERDGVYRFDRTAPRERIFSIDTPPPTVSGSLHVGRFSPIRTPI